MRKQLHIVSFDVPFPPDYGGVLDVYLRAKALKQAGYSVILHCYEYGRGRNHDFSEIADEIHYYDRKTGLKSLLSRLPYIVKSRNSTELLSRLLADNAPILLEGQHNTFWASELLKHQRSFAIRMHNVEWQYYDDLAKSAKTYSERLFFGMEARKLKRQELTLKKIPVLCISESDQNYYNNLGFHAVYLPVTIHPDLVLEPVEGKRFALFHGNLSVAENIEAIHALLAENKRKRLEIPVVIAGKNPDKQLLSKIQNEGWECIANPSDSGLDDLLRSCSVHLLIGFKTAGIKLKVIRALLSGKPCIATEEMLGNPTFEKYCELWNPSLPLAEKLEEIRVPGEQEIRERLSELEAVFGIEKLEAVFREIGLSK
ncbi:glycosyltransferase [Fluviicola sp.]|uniref:glycosyltransferase n=1 Tax=Fluviicola sp. TaxID=1917219 RepID=UPI002627E340|nr:glycosyltransferase [Fluviicola sp.]